MSLKANIVICGAGIAGISAAYHLAVRHGIKDIILVDEGQPLTLTSSQGNEMYRNWWPGPDDTMVRLMSQSIDLLEALQEESKAAFRMGQIGYAFLTTDWGQVSVLQGTALEAQRMGAGDIFFHPYDARPYTPASPNLDSKQTGIDLLRGPDLIHRYYPFLAGDVVGLLHLRRCGWLDVPELGQWLLAQAQECGLTLRQDRLASIKTQGGRVTEVCFSSGETVCTDHLVVATGPYLKHLDAILGLDVPVYTELHGKILLEDVEGVVPPECPYLIWTDPVTLPWSDSEREKLAKNNVTKPLLETLPSSVRFRLRPPKDRNSPLILGMWSYDIHPQMPSYPPEFLPFEAETVLRGLAQIAPGLSIYCEGKGQLSINGGYYCKTLDNRPLIGPVGVDGVYILGALSGYGVMASQAAAELLASHLTATELPDYASAFDPARFASSKEGETRVTYEASGQL